MKRRLRGPAALVIAAVTAVGASGCAVFSPVQTLVPYEPSDGFSAQVGDLEVRNALVVASTEGGPGALSATLVNSAGEDAVMTISAEGAEELQVDVPSGLSVVLNGEAVVPQAVPETSEDVDLVEGVAPTLVIDSVPVQPGLLLPVTFTSGGFSIDLDVPVLLPRYEYEPLAPEGAQPVPEPTTQNEAESEEPEPLEDDAEFDGAHT